MYCVYVLRSLKSSKKYVGVTSKKVDKKVEEHNHGATSWTRSNKPFQMIYSEYFDDKSHALKREKFFKTGNGRRALDNLISGYSPPQDMAEKKF